MALLAGLVEKEGDRLYNTYVCVTEGGMVAKYRKIHPFISKYLSPGEQYVVFNLYGCRCGIYAVFSNPVGPDGDQLKNGNSMVPDPYGEVLSECRSMDDEVVVARCAPDKLELAGGYRYRNARKPELYGEILGKSHITDLNVEWMKRDHSK